MSAGAALSDSSTLLFEALLENTLQMAHVQASWEGDGFEEKDWINDEEMRRVSFSRVQLLEVGGKDRER